MPPKRKPGPRKQQDHVPWRSRKAHVDFPLLDTYITNHVVSNDNDNDNDRKS